jgi:hypothetical protein
MFRVRRQEREDGACAMATARRVVRRQEGAVKGAKVKGQGRGCLPSVFATIGRVVLLSLGEDMFELSGEVRAVEVAAMAG